MTGLLSSWSMVIEMDHQEVWSLHNDDGDDNDIDIDE